MRSWLIIAMVLSTICSSFLSAQSTQSREGAKPEFLFETSIGMRERLEELPLKGSKLRPKPVTDPQKADVILRVLNVFPHGDSFRYNLEVTAFVAGTLNLADYLEREDGTAVGDLPNLKFRIKAFLPLAQLEPNELKTEQTEWVGGYLASMLVFALLWIVGLFAILFLGKKKKLADRDAQSDRPLTLADRLKPLVEKAQRGELDNQEKAALERLLVAHWRQRRGLETIKLGEAIAVLRRDEEAGPLFLRLEQWFHAPTPVAIDSQEITKLLEPFRETPDLSPAELVAAHDLAVAERAPKKTEESA